MAAEVDIPQPVTSGATDQPNITQGGTPEGQWTTYKAPAVKAPEGQWTTYKAPAVASKPAAGVASATPPPPAVALKGQGTSSSVVDAAKRYGIGLAQSLGVPTSQEELKAAAPSPLEMAAGPGPSAVAKNLWQSGKTLYQGAKDTAREAYEAGQNIGAGGPILKNLAKPVSTAVNAEIGAIPFIGEPTVKAGEDITQGNYAGAAGGLTGVVGQLAMESGGERGLGTDELKFHDAKVKEATINLKEAQKGAAPYQASIDAGKELPKEVQKPIDKAQDALQEAKQHQEIAKQAIAQRKIKPAAPEPATAQVTAQPQTTRLQPMPTMRRLGPAENVKLPGQVQPETFPQAPTARPVVEPGQKTLANDQGTVGMRKMLTEGTPQAAPVAEAPKAEAPAPSATMAKLGKPERGNLKQLKVDDTGKVIDTKPEDRLDTLLQQSLKPAETVKPAAEAKAPAEQEPKVRGQERRQETTPVAEERRTGERRNAAGIRVDAEGNPVMSPDVQGHWQSAAFGEKPAEDIGAKAREANPEPTRAETKGEAAKPTLEKTVPATEPGLMKAGEEGKEQPKSAAEYHPAVREQVTALPDEKLKQLAKAHGLNPDEYDFKTRDEGRHRTERDQLAEEVTKQMGDDEKINIGRSAEQLEHKAEMANKTKAERAASLFPRLRGPVDEFGNPKVAGGAPTEDEKKTPSTSFSQQRALDEAAYKLADKLYPANTKIGTAEGARSDNEHFANAKKELGPKASISDVAKRAQEMKDEAAKPVDLSKIAAEHNQAEGRDKLKPETVETSPRAKETAKAYEDMKHDPNNPEVKESYAALIDDTKKQWDRLEKAGIKIVPTDEDPYKSHEEMMDDLKNNKQLKVFRGGNPLPEDHPLNKVDPDTGEKYNTMFRAVHDAFGHGMEGHDFSEKGEENAWNIHRQMMSPKAIPAMTTETRGQTSWFFNHGEEPGKFAEQKAGILPDYANEPTPDSKAALDHIKSGKDYAVLTAENPNNKRLSPEENATRNRALVADLKDKGYDPIPVEGNNKDVEGRTERSFLVKNIPPKEAAELGRKHGQESVLTTQGLHHLDTDVINPSDNSKLMTGDEAKKQDYSTKVGDQDFSVPIDFDKSVNTKGSPVDEFGNPTVSGGSQAADKGKTKELPTGDQLIKKYGESSGDPADTTFILKDGRGVKNTGSDHDTMLGGKATDKNPPREKFIADGNIRIRPRMGMGNREVSMSIPESGINAEQLAYIQKMAPQLRSGAVLIEVGKPGGDYRILSNGDASTENLHKAISELAPIKNDKGSPIDQFGNPTVGGGSQGAGTAAAKEPTEEPLHPLAEKHLTPEEKAGVSKSALGRKNFAEGMAKVPALQEWVDAAKGGEGARQWYQRSSKAFDAMREEAPKYFQEGDKEKWGNFVASLSPRQMVHKNLEEAINAWTQWVDDGRPLEDAALNKNLRDAISAAPNTKVPNAMKALQGKDMWPDLSKNRNFKVPSFGKNLNGYLNYSTNDGWQALFGGLNEKTVSSPSSYHPLSVMTRAAAEELGWEPAEAQAAIWSFTQALKERGEVDPHYVRDYSEDFADIMAHNPQIRVQLKNLGVDLGKLDTKLEAIGEKPKVTTGASATTGDSTKRLAERIEKARGEGTVPEPKQQRSLFYGYREAPATEGRSRLEPDEETEFDPNKFRTQTNVMEKPGKKSPLKKMGQ